MPTETIDDTTTGGPSDGSGTSTTDDPTTGGSTEGSGTNTTTGGGGPGNPPPPPVLGIVAVTSTTVSLQWTATAGSFRLERSTDGVTWSTVYGGAATSYVNTNLNVDTTTYRYRVIAIGTIAGYQEGESAPSNIVITLTKPTGLAATPVSTTQIDLVWNLVVGASSYSLQRSTDQVNWVDISLGGSSVGTASAFNLTPNTLYHFQLAAYNNDMAYSNFATTNATTLENLTPPCGPWRDILVRKIAQGMISVSWTSPNANARSWIFINGRFAVGPYYGEITERTVTLRLPPGETFVIEVHEFDDDTVPKPFEEAPLVRPNISWNGVDTASSYRIYHSILDGGKGGTMETLLCEVPPVSGHLEIDCPVRLEGKNGKWHSFRVESVDQFNNESENEIIAHFAADLPPKPTLMMSRDTVSGLLSFRII